MKKAAHAATWLLILAMVLVPLVEAKAEFETVRVPQNLHSGVHDGPSAGEDAGAADSKQVFTQPLTVVNASWMCLHFDDWNLGASSYILMMSSKDGAQQRLDATTLPQWRGKSAFFNGDQVTVDLFAAPGDRGVYFHLKECFGGEWIPTPTDEDSAPPLPTSICGTTDERVRSFDDRVGRTLDLWSRTWCTAWTIANGAYLTAGHCYSPTTDLEVLEFNIPLSDPDGAQNLAHPDDQYAVDHTTVEWQYATRGEDWCIFGVFPNPNTGLLPTHAQDAFFRVTIGESPANVRVTGCGLDESAPETGDGPNASNSVQQTHSGPFLLRNIDNANDAWLRYQVDTRNSGSGSPVISTANSSLTLGIHTSGTCNGADGGNHGTAFENGLLRNAVNDFPSSTAVYVDRGHPAAGETGTMFEPYDTVAEGAAATPPYGVLSVVEGTYGETLTITTPMTFHVPVGTVTIGE